MLPFIRPEIFPNALLPLIAHHFKNPTASSDTDARLSVALQSFDQNFDKNFVYQLPYGSTFRTANGRVFKKGDKKIKRYECTEVTTGRIYLFQPNAPIEPL